MDISSDLMSTAVGLVLGAVLTGAGFLVKTHFERKAKLNEALFSLLELYRLVAFATGIDVRRIIHVTYDELEKQLPGQGREASANVYRSQILNMMAEILSSQWENFDKTIGQSFSATCAGVAAADPLLAARINGAQFLKGCLPAIERYNDNVREMVAAESDASIIDANERMHALVQANTNKKYMERLQECILMLAWRCGIGTFVRCRFSIWQHRRRPIQGQYEQLMREWVRDIITSSKAQN